MGLATRIAQEGPAGTTGLLHTSPVGPLPREWGEAEGKGLWKGKMGTNRTTPHQNYTSTHFLSDHLQQPWPSKDFQGRRERQSVTQGTDGCLRETK